MRFFLLFFNLVLFFCLFSQEKTELIFHVYENKILPKKIPKTKFNTKEKALKSLVNLKRQLQEKGYIESSIDSLNFQESYIHVYLFLGKKYQFSVLENGNLPIEVLKKIHFLETNFIGEKVSFVEIERLKNKILSYYENNGYPFAEVYLDSISIKNNKVSSKIYANPYKLFLIDTIIIHGNTNTKSKYIQNYLGIKKGTLYNKTQIDKINNKINQLKFIKENRDVQIVFLNGKVEIHIFLEKQKSNEINLLLGILPNDKLTSRKITITGDGRLHLLNSFGVGEEIYLDFKQLKPKTQNLDLRLLYPYFINLPLGVNAEFNLYKNDTSYININSKVGILYSFNGIDNIQLFYQNKISNVLNFDTTSFLSNKQPELLDKTTNNIGLQFNFQNLDYVLNPRKGFKFSFTSKIGTRKIRKNSVLQELDNNFYSTIARAVINYNLELKLDYYIPFYKRHSFLISNKSSFLISKDILANDKYKIGGSQLLRGFDEEDIITPFFSIFKIEYHFSLTKNSYFYTFVDFALVEDVRLGSTNIDTPIGFGLGATFETKGGIFSLSYALGKQLDNQVELKNGKIHFGYINFF